MASLGELFVTVGANVAGFKQAMSEVQDGAQGASDKINKQLLGAVTALTGAAVAAGLAFDDAIDKIRIDTGADGAQLDALAQSFKNVYAALPSDSTAVATAIADINTRLGLMGTELENAATQMLNLSRITDTDVKTIVNDATRLFGDWSIATKDQGDALDYVFRVSQSTGTEVDKLMQLLVQFGSPMRQLGTDFETSAALIGNFHAQGVNTELVLGSLRIALTRMANEGIPDAKTGLDNIITSIKTAETTTDATRLAVEAFGAKAGPDMAAAIREGRFELDGLVEKLAGSNETINGAAAATDGFKESLANVKNNLTLLLEPLGTVLIQGMEAVLNIVVPVVDKLKALREEVGGLAAPLQAAIGLLGPVGIAIGALQNNTKDATDKTKEYHPELKKAADQAKKVGDEHEDAKPKIKNVKEEMEKAKKKAEDLKTAYSKLGLKDRKKEAEDYKDAIDKLKSSGDWAKLSAEDQKTALDKLDAATFAAKGKAYDFSLQLNTLSTSLKTLYTDTSNETFALDTLVSSVNTLTSGIQNLPLPGMIQDMIDAQTETAKAAGNAITFKDNLATLGITGKADLELIRDKAIAAKDAVLGSDLATDFDKKTAVYKALKAQVEYARQVGQDVPAEQLKMLAQMESDLGMKDKGLPSLKAPWEKFSNEVSTIITNFAQDISKSLWDGDTSWGKKGLDLLKSLGEAVTSSFITPAVTAITGFVTNTLNGLLGGALDGIAKKFGSIFGGGAADAASGGVGVPTGGGAPSTGGGGGMSGGGGGGLDSITGIVTAISAVISNFQQAHMNTALGRIEESTRYTKIYLGDLLPKLTNDFASVLPSINDRLIEFRSIGIAVWPKEGYEDAFKGGTGVNITIQGNVIGTDDAAQTFADIIAGKLAAQGAV